MTAGRRLLLNIRALAVAKAATLLGALVTAAWTARVLGPESFGVLGFGTSLMAWAALFVNLGLSTYAVREIARDRAQVTVLAEHVLTLRVLLAVVVGTAYAAFVLTLDKSALVRTVLLVQAVQLLGNALVLDFVYQATERMGVIASREIGTSLGSMVLVLLLVRGPEDAPIAAGITAGSLVINAALMLARFHRDFGRLRPRVDLKAWGAILRPAAPMAVSAFAWAVFSHLDLVMLGFLRSEGEVGWYSSAVRVYVLSCTAGHIVMNAFLPQLAAAYGDSGLVRRRMEDFATAMLSAGFLVAAGGLALAPAIVALLFGPDYAPATDALRLLMVATALTYLNMVLGNPLMLWHRQTAYMAAILGGGAVNAALNVVLIPRYGIEGAAVATVASVVASTAGMAWHHRKAVGRLYGGIAGRALLCALVAMGGWGALERAIPEDAQPHALLTVLGGGIVIVGIYGAMAVLTGLIRPARLRRLKGVTA
ncbi:oligosaccharide flippase family protein [Azospirillum thermophilum]|uniref:Flippase n=1 Tax=Azospirillum thermophilum TaxID=2202148 RepID=A0A2S2CPC6_9PROT|nr:oligosaccharide flippase family protein [Azospirillum thermophilum]AWK86318.1 flippase [Azospirillum thermophilum]